MLIRLVRIGKREKNQYGRAGTAMIVVTGGKRRKRKMWELRKIFASENVSIPKLSEGWEPFAIDAGSNGCWIWLKRRVG